MPGLDPGIHSVTLLATRDRYGMDRRVKPGDDDKSGLEPFSCLHPLNA
jgi:hypothetical protein